MDVKVGSYMENEILEALAEYERGECKTYDNVEDFLKSLRDDLDLPHREGER